MKQTTGAFIQNGYPVAGGNNRTNASQVLPVAGVARSNVYYSGSISAGSTIPVPVNGTQFYVLACSSSLDINYNPGGTFQTYYTGTGLQLDDASAFTSLQVRNNSSSSVSVLIFIGFGKFIDNRLIIDQNTNPNVCVATSITPSTSPLIQIPDKSGMLITSAQGKQYYAMSRTSIIVSNVDQTQGVYLQAVGVGSLTNNASGVVFVPPTQDIVFPCSGDYAIKLNGSTNVNVIVSEIYTGIPASTL